MNCYILPAGTYKITETGYNAVTTSGATLTTTASYSVDGNAVSTDYAVVTVENDGSSVVMVGNTYSPITYNLWVGGVEVTEQNAHDVLGDGGTVSYIPDTNTLTLSDFSYDGPEIGIAADVDLTIKLIGENNAITSTNNSGIEVTGAVTIVGDGTLRVSSTNGNGIEASDDINITDGTVSVTADDDHCGIVSLTSITIGGEDNPTVTVGCKVGLDAPIVTIKNSCTLTITSRECAIATAAPLNFPEGNWYQWKGDDGTLYRSGIGADDRLLTKEDGAANKSLKIEPIATEPNTYTVTLMNGDKVWHVFTGISDGQTLRVILTMPPPSEGGPAGSMFYRWYTESDEWIRHDTVINEDKVAYATWKQPIAGTVTFSGDPVVGETLRAEAHITTNVPYLNYQWLFIEGENKMAIPGANSDTYTPTSDDVGKLLACAVSCPEAAPSSIIAEAGIVRGSGSGGYYPIYIPTAPQQSTELVTSPETFDSGIATSVVLTLLAATGTAWLGKKKD